MSGIAPEIDSGRTRFARSRITLTILAARRI